MSTTFLTINVTGIFQGLFAFLYISFLLLLAFSAFRKVLRMSVDHKEDRIFSQAKRISTKKREKKTPEEFYFDYSTRNHVRFFYFGQEVLYATIVSDKVYFFWSHNRKQAAPILAYRADRTGAIETVIKNVHLKSLKVIGKRTTGDVEKWDILKPEHENKSLKNKRKALDIEVN